MNILAWYREHKVLASDHKVLAALEAANYRPTTVAVQISRRCNLECSMCGWKIWQRNKGFMSLEIFGHVLRDMAKDQIQNIVLSAAQGEPLLNPQSDKFINLALDCGFNVEINTNCTTLGDRNIETLVAAAARGRFCIQASFSGYNAYTHETVYKGSRFFDTSSKLAKLNSQLTAKGLAHNLYVNGIIYEPDKEQLHRDHLASLGIHDRIRLHQPDNFAGVVMKESYRTDLRGTPLRLCPVLTSKVVVYDDGQVSACACRDSENVMNIGDINANSLSEIRNGLKYKALLSAFMDRDLSNLPLCRACDIPYGESALS